LDRGSVKLDTGILLDLSHPQEHLAQVTLKSPTVEIDGAFAMDPNPKTGPAKPFQLQIDDLEISDARIRIDDHERNSSLHASSFSITGIENASRPGWHGRLAGEVSVRDSPIGVDYPLSFVSRYAYTPGKVRLVGLEVSGPGVSGLFSGDLDWRQEFLARLEGDVDLELDAIEPYLDESMPRFSGAAEANLHILVDHEGWLVEGPLVSSDVHVDDLVARQAQARLIIDQESVTLEELVANSFGGVANGRVVIGIGGPTTIDLDLDSKGVSAEGLLAWIGVPLPVASTLAASLRLTGTLGDRTTWDGEGTFVGEAMESTLGGLPTVVGAGEIAFDAGVMSLRAEAVELASATLTVDGQLRIAEDQTPGRIVLNGSTSDASATHQGVEQVLAALGEQLPQQAAWPLTGSGTLSAGFSLQDSAPLELAVDLKDGGWGLQEFDRLRLSLTIDDDRLAITDTLLWIHEQRLEGDFAIDMGRSVPLEVDVNVHGFYPAFLLEQLGLAEGVSGIWSGDLSAQTTEGGLEGAGSFTVENVSMMDHTIRTASTQVTATSSVLSLGELRAEGDGFELRGRGTWDLIHDEQSIEIDSAVLELGDLAAWGDEAASVAGELTVTGRIDARADGLQGELTVRGHDIHSDPFQLGDFEGNLALLGDRLAFRADSAADAGWQVDGTLLLVEPLPAVMTVQLDETPLGSLHASLQDQDGSVSGTFDVHVSLSEPEGIQIEGTVTDASSGFGAHELRLLDPFDLVAGPSGWTARGLHLGSGDTQLRGNAQSGPAADEVSASLAGRVNLAMLSAVEPEIRAAGTADVDLRAAYSTAGLDLDGSVEFVDGRLHWLGFPETIAALTGRMRFRDSELTVDTLTGRFGGGEIHVVGGANLLNPSDPEFEFDLSAANVRLDGPEGFRGIYDADLTWKSLIDHQTLVGRVEVLRGLYDEPFDLGGIGGAGGRAVSGTAIEGLPLDLEFDVDIIADSGVWLRNDLIEGEATMDLELVGTAARPEIAGRAALRDGGQIRFRDLEYRILTATLDFVDPARLDPYITLHAVTQVAEYAIHLRVEGTASQFEYDLTSTPSLAQQDIIALLTTGRTMQDLSGRPGRTEFTGDLAANYFAGALTDRFERQLERVLRLERFQIDPLLTQEDADPTARITIGKAVTDDLFVILSTDLNSTEDQLYEIQWRLSRKTRASATRDTEGGIGGDIQYYDRYWWKKPDLDPDAEHEAAVALRSSADIAGDEVEARIESIFVGGLTGNDRDEARRRIKLNVGDPYRRSTMFAGIESLRKMLVGRGHIEAEVNAVATPIGDGARVKVEYWVSRGRILTVEFDGVDKKDERKRLDALLRDRWSVVVFGDDLYDDAIQQLLADFHARGYYAADVQHFERVDDDGQLVCVFSVDRGPVVRVRELEIEGVENLPAADVRRQLLTRTASLLQKGLLVPGVLKDDVRAIAHLYRSRGFLDVEVDDPRIRLSRNGENASINILVHEGQRSRVGELTFSGESPFPDEEMHGWLTIESEQTYSPIRMLEAESAVRAKFDSHGYADARVRSSVTREADRVHVEFELVPGTPKRLHSIEILGAQSTRENVIKRALQLEPGELISRDALLRSQHELYRTGVFSNVRLTTDPAAVGEEGDAAEPQVLTVRVEEARPLATSVGIGYDSEGGERISFSASHQNIGGRNRILSLQGHASDILTRVQFIGEAPHLFGRKDPVLVNLSVEDRDEIGFKVLRRSAAIRFDRRWNRKWNSFTRYNYQRVDLREIEDSLAVTEEKLENLGLGDVGFTVVRDSRDDPLLPRRGTYGSLSTRLFAPAFGGEVAMLKTQMTVSWVHTFSNQITLASGMRLGLAEPFGVSERVPLSERFFAGGDSTVRGFGRDELGPMTDGLPAGGESMFIFNQEFRFPLFGPLRGNLFYDAGNIYPTIEDFDVTDIRHVLGIGLRYETAIGPLRLEYGRKLDREVGESDAELFFAIGTAF